MSDPEPTRRGFLARAIARTPGRVVLLCLLVIGIAGAVAWSNLGIQTDRMALIGDHHRYNQVFRELRAEFGDLDAMIVLVRGEPAAARAAAADLARRLGTDPERFPRVFWRVPPDALGGKGLLFVEPAVLEEIAGRLEGGRPAIAALRERGLGPFYGQLAAQVRALGRGEAQQESAPTYLPNFLDQLEGALEGHQAGKPPWEAWIPASAMAGRDGYTWTEDGRLVVLVQPPPGRGEAAVASLREVLAAVASAHPQVSLSLTGEPVLEADELITFREDATRATLLSLLGVTVLLWLAMRRLLGPLLAVASVAAAVITTLGAAAIWPGHLNLISLALCALMVGLGIDFAIHWISRYDDARERGARGDEALAQATQGSGRAIAAGALTTALGFLATLLTEVDGLREFGVVAATGVLLALAASLILLPALTVLADRTVGGRQLPRSRWPSSALALALDALVERWPRAILAVALSATLGAGWLAFGADRLRYDPNLLALQAERLPSVRLADELLHDPALSGMFAAVVVKDAATLASVESKIRALPSVGGTRSILDLVPAEQPRKLAILARLRGLVDALPAPSDPRDTPAALALGLKDLGGALQEVGDLAIQAGRPADAKEAVALEERAEGLARRFEAATPSEAERLAAHGAALRVELTAALAQLRRECASEALSREDLPPALRDRLVGRSGKLLLRVYPKEAVWAEEPLARFVAEVQSVAPGAGGVPIQFYESDRLLRRGFVRAGQVALLFVIAYLILHFRSILRPLVATLTLLIGASWALGVLLLSGWTLNPANLLALPLTFGIGVDYAIHVIHSEREAMRGPTLQVVPRVIATASGRAVILSALTTAVGFGALTFSAHRGVASIGLTVSVGVLGCLLSALLVCPALLRLVGGGSYAPLLRGLPGPKTGPGGVVRRPEPDPPHSGLDDDEPAPEEDPAL